VPFEFISKSELPKIAVNSFLFILPKNRILNIGDWNCSACTGLLYSQRHLSLGYTVLKGFGIILAGKTEVLEENSDRVPLCLP
jgi:hypothetical protein